MKITRTAVFVAGGALFLLANRVLGWPPAASLLPAMVLITIASINELDDETKI